MTHLAKNITGFHTLGMTRDQKSLEGNRYTLDMFEDEVLESGIRDERGIVKDWIQKSKKSDDLADWAALVRELQEANSIDLLDELVEYSHIFRQFTKYLLRAFPVKSDSSIPPSASFRSRRRPSPENLEK